VKGQKKREEDRGNSGLKSRAGERIRTDGEKAVWVEGHPGSVQKQLNF